MATVLDSSTIARMVSHVSEVMFGVTFTGFAPGETRGESLCSRMARLPLRGSSVEVVLSFDRAGSRALAAAFHSCPASKVNECMIDRAIAELLKLVALQVQASLNIQKPLGTPRRTTLAAMAHTLSSTWSDAVHLRSDGLGDLRLWVIDGRGPAPVEGQPARTILRGLRSLIQGLLPF